MFYLILTAGIFLFDYALKSYVDKHYHRKEKHPHLNGKLIVEKYYNKGAALNLLSKRPKILLTIHHCFQFGIAVFFYFLLRYSNSKIAKTGAALLLGGGLSNLFDRHTKGHVIDYFHINIGPKWLRRIIFNVSDFCIFIGALLTVLSAEHHFESNISPEAL